MNPEDDFKSISLMYHIYKLFAVHVDVQVRLSASLKETNWLLDGVNWNFGRSKSLLYVSTNVLRNQKGKKLIVIELLSSRSTVNVQLSTWWSIKCKAQISAQSWREISYKHPGQNKHLPKSFCFGRNFWRSFVICLKLCF